MKDKILNLFKDKDRRAAITALRHDEKLKNWLLENTPECDSLSERVALLEHGDIRYCIHGNRRKFSLGKHGYCGKAKTCKCLMEKISTAKPKKLKTEEELIEIRKKAAQKRKQTMIAKYGVDHYMKLDIVKETFDFPFKKKEIQDKIDRTRSKESMEKAKETSRQKYGVDNYSKTDEAKEKIKQTMLIKYGVDNFSKTDEFKKKMLEYNKEFFLNNGYKNGQQHYSNETQEILNTKDLFSNIVNNNSITESARILEVHPETIRRHCQKYNITYSNSYLEDEMASFLDSLNVSYIKNTRSIISPKELDFYLPDFDLAIEMCGLYWHSDIHKTKNYHYNKWLECNKNNVQLITIYENEWNDKKDIVKNIIKSRLNFKKKGIYARDTEVRSTSASNVKEFLNKYHIQGFVGGKHYAAYFENEIVGVISFGYTRNQNFELKRFVSNNKNNPGLFSKIFKWAQNDLQFNKVVSFSDNRYFNGNLYIKNNFKIQCEYKEGYNYFYQGKLYHSSRFTKANIQKEFPHVAEMILEGKTEREVMDYLKIPRIWDCGKIAWEWSSQ